MRKSAEQGRGNREPSRGWRHVLGYFLYALAAAGISLWLLFPSQSLQGFLTRALEQLAPGIAWQVEGVELQLPFVLCVSGVDGFTGRMNQAPSVQIEQLKIWPDWEISLREKALWLGYQLRLGGGTLQGRICRQKHRYRFNGKAQALQLESVPLLASQLGRKLQGTISAAYEGRICPGAQVACTWKAQATLEKGQLALVRPLLHHADLPFDQVSMLLRGEGKEITIAEGKLDSPLGKGWFNGTLMVMADPLQSQIKLRGGMHPQPAFFSGLENTAALQSVRFELGTKPLPFSLSGPLLHPGIHFEGLAMPMHALEREIR